MPLLVLVLGILLSGIAFRIERKRAESEYKADFELTGEHITNALKDRIHAHKQILRSGAAMVMISGGVTREQWRIFSQLQQLKESMAGIQGYGLSVLVPREELARHLREVRATGYPNYKIWPEGDRAAYSSIIYLEPFEGRNLRAFGYDMYSELTRRQAMQEACDQDTVSISGKVILVQEYEKDIQAGTLMYAPVYRSTALNKTVAERRAALIGWVYSPYRMDDMIGESLRAVKKNHHADIRIQIFDGNVATPENLLYDNDRHKGMLQMGARSISIRTLIQIPPRVWLIQCSIEPYKKTHFFDLAVIELLGGSVVSLMLAGLMFSLLNTRGQAMKMAQRLTDELRQSDEIWQFAIKGSGVGVWDWNMKNGTVTYSRRWKEMLGYKDNELGHGLAEWSERVYPEDLKRALAALKDHCEGRSTSYQCEIRMRAKDGSCKWISDCGLVVLRDDEGKPLRMIGTHTDITAAKLHEMELSKLLDQERQVSEMKTRFISVTSHEFRTPMAAALTSVELLMNHSNRLSPQKNRSLLERINLSLWRMSQMLDDVLTLNRLDQERIEVKLAAIQLDQLVLSTIEEVQLADRNGHQFNCHALDKVILVTDSSLVHHILTNLLQNAVRYSPAGSIITMRINLSANWVTVVVEDQGIGVPAADAERIFEPFERGSNVGEIKGTGLGLNIVKKMTQKLDGKIVVTPNEGGGSCFTISLPRRSVPDGYAS